MFRLVRLIVPLLLISTGVLAQGNPNLITGQVPNAVQWNSYFAAKVDVNGGTLNGPTINNPLFTGIVAFGATQWPGPFVVTGSISGTSGAFGSLTVNGNTLGTAAFAGLGTSGTTVPLLSSANTWGGTQNFGSNTISGSSLVFTGGTLTGLAHVGGSMSGTFTGSPTFSGNPLFSGTPSFPGNLTFGGNLSFTGSPTFSGPMTFTNTVGFSAAVSFSGGATISIANTGVGALTTDQAQINSQLNGASTGAQIFQMIIGCPSCLNADAVRGVATATNGSTTTNVNGIAGYVLNQNVSGGLGQNAVAVFGVGIGVPNGASTWGINVNLTDSITPGVVSAGTGKFLNNEYDFNITSPNTQVNGLILQGASPSIPLQANGFVVNNLRIGTFAVPWSNAFYSADGGANTALLAGTLGTPFVANASSQAIAFIRTDGSQTQHPDLLYTTPNGMVITATAFSPSVSAAANLGSSSLPWGNLFVGNAAITAGGSLAGTFTGSPTFSGSPNFSGGGTLTGMTHAGGALSGTFTGSPTLSGNLIFSGNPSFSGNPAFSGSMSFSSLGSAALTAASGRLIVLMNGSTSAATMLFDLTANASYFNADAIQGAATNISGSTVANVNGIAGYVLNQNATVGSNSVAVYGGGISAVNGSSTWGLNTNLTDNTSQVVSAGTGRNLNNELDFNVTSPNTNVNGLILQGASVSQPALANGFVVSNLKAGSFTVPWSNAFFSANGASSTAFLVGTFGNPANANAQSQPLALVSTNASAVQQVTEIYSTTAGITINRGTITFTGGLTSGTASTYACFTSGGVLVSQVGACP